MVKCRWEVFGNHAHFGKQAGPVWEGFETLGKGLGMFWESCLFTVLDLL